jgi:hypothetical protein
MPFRWATADRWRSVAAVWLASQRATAAIASCVEREGEVIEAGGEAGDVDMGASTFSANLLLTMLRLGSAHGRPDG